MNLPVHRSMFFIGGCVAALLPTCCLRADDDPFAAAEPPAAAPSKKIVIADEPRSVDPVSLVPKQLAAKARVQFKESSLSDVAAWIQKQTKLQVALDRRSLEEGGILSSEPVADQLDDAPLYLLLDRLQNIGVDWRIESGVIHLTAASDDSHLYTTQYNVWRLV